MESFIRSSDSNTTKAFYPFLSSHGKPRISTLGWSLINLSIRYSEQYINQVPPVTYIKFTSSSLIILTRRGLEMYLDLPTNALYHFGVPESQGKGSETSISPLSNNPKDIKDQHGGKLRGKYFYRYMLRTYYLTAVGT